jgi:hypothetical protein
VQVRFLSEVQNFKTMNKLDELNVIKEYLLDEIHSLIIQSDRQAEFARKGQVSEYVVNIIINELKRREDQVRHMLDNILQEIEKYKEVGKLFADYKNK